jgi:hypothetical protein
MRWFGTIIMCLVACTPPLLRSSPPLPGGGPRATLTDFQIDFGGVPGGAWSEAQVSLLNMGEAPLQLHSVALEGSPAFSLLDQPSNVTLLAGDERVFDLRFTPADPGAHEATVAFHTSDPQAPMLEVGLLGHQAEPVLALEPFFLDLGTVRTPCTATEQVTVSNVGELPLTLNQIGLEGPPSLVLTVAPPLPTALASRSEIVLEVTFAPGADGLVEGRLTVNSDDARGDQFVDIVAAAEPAQEIEEHFEVVSRDQRMILAWNRAADTKALTDHRLHETYANLIAALDLEGSGWTLGILQNETGCFSGGVFTAEADVTALVAATKDSSENTTTSMLGMVEAAVGLIGPGACNEGFDDLSKPLHVVVISHAEDESTSPPQVVQGALEEIVDDPSDLVISGVLAITGACGHMSKRVATLAENTGGVLIDLCMSDWPEQLATLPALTPPDPAMQLLLADEPDLGSISVTLDDAPITGWTYAPTPPRVELHQEPPASSVVRVRYTTPVECD